MPAHFLQINYAIPGFGYVEISSEELAMAVHICASAHHCE
jgi:hypothetical protein